MSKTMKAYNLLVNSLMKVSNINIVEARKIANELVFGVKK